MSKAVLISIRPKWCEKICRGEKTIEVRKTRPKLNTPFKCYIYCTMDHPYISVSCGELDKLNYRTNTVGRCSGKVIGEFICDRIDWIVRVGYMGSAEPIRLCVCDPRTMITQPIDGLLNSICLTAESLASYLASTEGCGWHISDLKIYDAPRELGELRRACPNNFYCESCAMYRENDGTCGNESLCLKRPPQNWCYVEEM